MKEHEGAGRSMKDTKDSVRSYHILEEGAWEAVFNRLREEDLLWAFDCQFDAPDPGHWLEVCRRPDTLLLEGRIDGVPAGLLTLLPFQERTRCGLVGVTGYRGFFSSGDWLARGALLWCFEHLDCASVLGCVAAPNHHVLRMAPRVGFRILGTVPGACWYGRKQRFVDGVLMLATEETVKNCEV